MSLTIGSLCTGAGGLDLAVADVLGDVRTAWVAEVDPDAAKVLAARFGAPNLGDITTVDWRKVEPVDVIFGGWPCQPFSLAGKRKGMDDERAIWPAFADAIRVVRPRLFLGENVPGILARGQLGRVVAQLAGLGYVGSWLCLRAADVGAPHQRNRVFLVAADADRRRFRFEPVTDRARVGAAVTGGYRPQHLMPTPTASTGGAAGDLDMHGGGPSLATAVTLLPTPTVTNAHGNGHNNRGEPLLPAVVGDADRWAQYAPAIARWEAVLGRPAPEPTVTGKRGGRRLSARFVEWLMGWPEGWVTDLVSNTAGLRLCGNGVVRQQGAAAYRALLEARDG